MDNIIPNPYNHPGRVEGHSEDMKRILKYDKIGEFVAGEVKYFRMRFLCVDNMQKSRRTRKNDGQLERHETVGNGA